MRLPPPQLPPGPTLTSFFDLLLARLGGGHHAGGHLVDGAGALLQAAQVGAVLVRLHLGEGGGRSGSAPRTWASCPRGHTGHSRVEAEARLTLEAATSWAVLAAISWEQTMSSSYLPVCSTTLSADSLQTEPGGAWVSNPVDTRPRPHSLRRARAPHALLPPTWGDIHQLRGSPAHGLGGGDEAFRPPRVLGVKFLLRGCPLVARGGQGGGTSQ